MKFSCRVCEAKQEATYATLQMCEHCSAKNPAGILSYIEELRLLLRIAREDVDFGKFGSRILRLSTINKMEKVVSDFVKQQEVFLWGLRENSTIESKGQKLFEKVSKDVGLQHPWKNNPDACELLIGETILLRNAVMNLRYRALGEVNSKPQKNTKPFEELLIWNGLEGEYRRLVFAVEKVFEALIGDTQNKANITTLEILSIIDVDVPALEKKLSVGSLRAILGTLAYLVKTPSDEKKAVYDNTVKYYREVDDYFKDRATEVPLDL